MEVVAGAAIAGVRAMAAMKHVGLNVAADPLFTFSYTGINSGMGIINSADPGPWSSQKRTGQQASGQGGQGSHDRAFRSGRGEGFHEAGLPDVGGVRCSGHRAHHHPSGPFPGTGGTGGEKGIPVRDFVRRPEKHVMIPVFVRQRHLFKEEDQIPRLREYSNSSGLNRIEWGNKKRGIICDSVAYHMSRRPVPATPSSRSECAGPCRTGSSVNSPPRWRKSISLRNWIPI